MKKLTLTLIALVICLSATLAQSVGINSDGTAPATSAMLDVKSSTKGFLAPRVASTANVTSPVEGLLVYQTGGTAGFYYYTGSAWTLIGTGSGNGTLTDVTGTAPVVSSGGTTPAISITAASTGAAGSMSAADKTKLDGIATAANNYTHPTGDGNLHVIATGTSNSGNVLTAGASAGSLSWATPASGTVTSVTATSPIASSGGAAPVISLGTVPVANGGTGATTLTGYIMGTGTTAMTASATIPAANISGNISGNAANVTGTVAVANGGTGATTLTGYIMGTGTAAMTASATIPAASISGNISGNAANVTGTVAVANGGTGATSASAALTNLGAAPLASPTFTGTPAAPTAATGTNTTQLATTEFVNTAAGVHAIGDNYMGGKVFFVYDNGTHGLIAATADQSNNIAWSAGTFTNTIARANGVGAGSKNTAIIMANQGYGDGTMYAARICNEYFVTIGGVYYGDWYLPTHAELTLLYAQKTVVGSFGTGIYWSSYEADQTHAFDLNFGTGVWASYNLKSDYYSVRAIRAF